MTGLDPAVRRALDWPVDHVAACVVAADGTVLAGAGDTGREFALASVTKPLSAYAVLVAVEEGALDWNDPAGPDGATVRHLIAHTSGLAFDTDRVQAAPGERRIYSNTGFAVLADAVAEATGIDFADYLHQAVCEPLGLTATRLEGAAGAGAISTASDLSRFAAELQSPRLLDPRTVAEATTVAFPGLDGVLPGYGRQKPNDWGLGFEIRDGKSPHWTGADSSPRTFGHFGQSGTFLWVDPDAGLAAVVLTDRDFGQWAIDAWPAWTDGVLAARAG
ncbi:serine hydrolase domain-containing protein [Pseudonocardia sp. NPDC049635]|uniref:serine hydrolase domain-containing protein n=1 Tax=Pseudonocardia sp. NPDC049635 TaxID=3155506 RepID=UPI00340FE0EF